jgi:hypothetical protein
MANNRSIRWRVQDVDVQDQNDSNAVEIDVQHDKGGPNYFSGGYIKTGYYMSLTPVKVRDGSVSFLMGASIGRRYRLMDGDRFNAKKLDTLAQALKPKTADLVAALLRRDYDAIREIANAATGIVQPTARPTAPPLTDATAAEVTRAEDAIEDGQARWSETGSTR